MSQRVVTAHIPKALAQQVDELSKRLDRPRGWVMKEALERYVEAERSRYDLTMEALAEVDAGKTVAHADIEKWAASLAPPRKRRR
jgi:predicted transcriptional regulator